MRNAIVFLIYFLISQSVFAQSPFFQKFNLPDKSEKINIRVLFQDRDGFIWLGTADGLYQFDGFSFSHFASKDSTLDSQITAITQDSLGRIWLGHSSGQLSFLEKDSLKSFTPPEGNATREISDMLLTAKVSFGFLL